MKRLVILTTPDQEAGVRQLMDLHEVEVFESDSSFLDQASLWVKDEDYARAKELLEARVASDGREARAEHKSEWQREWHGSHVRWFFGTIRKNPRRIVRLMLLILLVWLFLLYPVWTLIQSR